MPTVPARLLSPEEEELERKQSQLAALETQLAERELERATLQAELAAVEKRYLEVVGRRYAKLDQLEAKIAEAQARQNPKDRAAKDRAEGARAQAEESARSVGDREEQTKRQKAGQSESLRTLYRQAAKLLHPDLTLDPHQKALRERLMAEVNEAYASVTKNGSARFFGTGKRAQKVCKEKGRAPTWCASFARSLRCRAGCGRLHPRWTNSEPTNFSG